MPLGAGQEETQGSAAVEVLKEEGRLGAVAEAGDRGPSGDIGDMDIGERPGCRKAPGLRGVQRLL